MAIELTQISSSEEFDPEELLASLKANGPSAFEKIFRRYERPLTYFLIGLLGNEHDAMDVLSEVFLSVFQNYDKCDTNFNAWIYAIARNRAMSFLRKKASRGTIQDLQIDDESSLLENVVDPSSDPFHLVLVNDSYARVSDAMKLLTISHSSIIQLRILEGNSIIETSEILKIARGTVKSRLNNALAKLRISLDVD